MDKPDGFDFNNRRSDKSNSSSDWTPSDALYSAHEGMSKGAKAAIVIWREADDTIRFRSAGGVENAVLLATCYLNHAV